MTGLLLRTRAEDGDEEEGEKGRCGHGPEWK